jgi:hypothetical protein
MWTLEIAKGIGPGKNLLVNVEYSGDRGSAGFGFRIRRAE